MPTPLGPVIKACDACGRVRIPATCPAVVDATGRTLLTFHPSVPRSVMPTPLGPVIKAWYMHLRPWEDLTPATCPASLMPESVTVISTQRPEIGHAHAIGAGDKSMAGAPAGREELPHHLPGVVDARGVTVNSTQRPEIGHAHAIGAGDKGMANHLRPWRNTPPPARRR